MLLHHKRWVFFHAPIPETVGVTRHVCGHFSLPRPQALGFFTFVGLSCVPLPSSLSFPASVCPCLPPRS